MAPGLGQSVSVPTQGQLPRICCGAACRWSGWWTAGVLRRRHRRSRGRRTVGLRSVVARLVMGCVDNSEGRICTVWSCSSSPSSSGSSTCWAWRPLTMGSSALFEPPPPFFLLFRFLDLEGDARMQYQSRCSPAPVTVRPGPPSAARSPTTLIHGIVRHRRRHSGLGSRNLPTGSCEHSGSAGAVAGDLQGSARYMS